MAAGLFVSMFRTMTSLNEHDKQLLETLLNQADAVAPAGGKVQQNDGDLDFHSTDHDEQDFQFLDHYINSELGEAEEMQLEQQTSTSSFGNHQTSQVFQTTETHQCGTAGASFQSQGSGFTGQQTGFTVQGSVHSPVQMEQSSVSGFQGHDFQHAAVQCSQSQGYPQQYTLETPSPGHSELGGHAVDTTYQSQEISYQTQAQQQCNDSTGHLQIQAQQVSQRDSAYPSSIGSEEASLSSVVYHSHNNNDYHHQQTFQNDYSLKTSAHSPLQTVGPSAGFGSLGSQPGSEQRDLTQQQIMQDFSNSAPGFQQHHLPTQQQVSFQQANQPTVNSSIDQQPFPISSADGNPFSGDMSTYSLQAGQQQGQGTTSSDAAVLNPDRQQHTHYKSPAESKIHGEQGKSEICSGQVNQYSKQQVFACSASSSGQSVNCNGTNYSQPSPNFSSPHTYHPSSTQTSGQGDQKVEVNFTEQVKGFVSGQISEFQTKSFQSPIQSPAQVHMDSSVPSSPASSYQQPSPGFPLQSQYPSAGQSPVQGDQITVGSFSTETAAFSNSVATTRDQGVAPNFQGNGEFSPKSTMQEDLNVANGFRARTSSFPSTSMHNGTDIQSQVFTSHLMQERSSMDAGAAAYLQNSFQSANQQTQSMVINSEAVHFQQKTPSEGRRDQPMETQQSPYPVDSSDSFQSQSPTLTPQALFHETVAEMTDVTCSANGFLDPNQALGFQRQSSNYQAVNAASPPALPSSNDSFLSGTVSNTPFTCVNSDTGTLFTSGQNTSTSFTLTSTTAPMITGIQPVASTKVTTQYNQTSGNVFTFSNFTSDSSSTFGPSDRLQQTQEKQVQQPLQMMQQLIFNNQSQDCNLLQNSNSHGLSDIITNGLTNGSQVVYFQPESSSDPPTMVTLTSSEEVLDKRHQFIMGQNIATQLINSGEEQAQGIQNLLGHASANDIPQNDKNPQQFAKANSIQVSSLPGSAPIPNDIGHGKSPSASLQDSNQTNTALILLSSVLQQIQAILPVATRQLHNSTSNSQPTTPAIISDDPEAFAKLLQSQNKAQQVLQLLQQQPNVQLQQERSQVTQENQCPSLSSVQRQTNSVQQPNFLLQQSNNQHLVLNQQQQTPLQQPQDELRSQGRQLTAAQIPASVVTSLAGSLGNLGITVGRDGQFVIGQQPVKVVLDASSSSLLVSGEPGITSAAVNTAAQTSVPANLVQTLSRTLSFPDKTGASQSQISCSSVPEELPVDLQNVSINLFRSASVTSGSSLNGIIHSVNTDPTTVHSIGSTVSTHTFVTPTSSFPQPLSVAGVGLGLGGQNNLGNRAFSTPSELNRSPNFIVSSVNPDKTPAVANIFYPVSTTNSLEKNMESSEYNMSIAGQAGNFLNVTAGSASMLLNAFTSMVAADGKDSVSLKDSGFNVLASSSTKNVLCDYSNHEQNPGKMDTSEMDVGENVGTYKSMDVGSPTDRHIPQQSFRKSSMEEDSEPKGDAITNSMLRRILTMKDEDGNSPNSKGGSPTPESPRVKTSPEICIDGNTQATLIEKSEQLKLCSDAQQDADDMQPEFWTSVPSFVNDVEDEVVPSKVHRGADDLDASCKPVSLPSVEKLFDAGGAVSSSAFVFTKFGAEVNGLRTFGSSTLDLVTCVNSSATETRVPSLVSTIKPVEPMKLGQVPTASIRPSTRRQKDPSLTFQFPSKVGEYELRILAQPEEQHRARYLTEGSRGAVKDRTQQGCPVVKLLGYNEPAILQVFIGSETGRVKPHGFYQACKVCGKNSTQCTEREIDGTNVIEIEISPNNDMQVNMDCVGILKLRNADVEKRIGPTKAKAKKKNSTKARLVFRCCLRKPDGSFCTLQIASTPILCTQPIGQPEISRMSLSELCVNQTSDLFIIGKNFLKGTKIMFQELGMDETDVKWQSEAEIEVEYFQQTHLICRIPDYPQKNLDHHVHCQIVAVSGGKVSDPQDFVYKPAMLMVKENNPMETEPSNTSKALPFGVSPVALQLNRLVERTQHQTSSSAMFQLPPGAIPNISTSSASACPSKVISSTPTHLQPLSSVLKPATLSLSGGPAGGKDMKGAVPIQFVLPPHAIGPAVTLESRKLSGQPHHLVLMSNQALSTQSGSTGHNNKIQPSVLTLTSVSSTSGTPSTGNAANGQIPTSSAPMIVILTGPPTTAVSTSTTANIISNSNVSVPLSLHQSINSSQVESLLKQILESSKTDSS